MRSPLLLFGLATIYLTAATGVAAAQPVEESLPPVALTPTEYNNTVADLLGFPQDGTAWPDRPPLANRISPRRAASKGVFLPPPPPPSWPWRFPEEPGSEGFEGIVQGQSPSSYQVEELHLAGMHFGAFALLSPTFLTCDGWNALSTDEQHACAWDSLERLAPRVYRRPLTEQEAGRLHTFWLENAAAYPSDEAVAITVAGLLQAPAFHFRFDPSADPSSAALTNWELASRLSYFLWDSMPDDALFTAAESGTLFDPTEIKRHARRMLNDPRARSAVVRFHHQWLGTENVLLVAPARRAFGPLFGLTPELKIARDDDVQWPAVMGPVRHSMKLETELFVEQAIFEGDGTFTALLTDSQGYMSDATKPIYGESAVPVANSTPITKQIEIVVASIGQTKPLTLYPTRFPSTERAGILTLPSVLALGAYAVQPGPILRGKRVLERVACMHLGTPIQGAESALPPDTLTAESTNRERTATATSSATCTTCHRLINPPGFAFEHYDAIGKWRDADNGQPVDASGALTLAGGEQISFTNGIDFVHQLAESDRVRDCYAMHWTRYALGTQLDASDPGLAPLQEQFRDDDSIRELLVSIAGSDLFRTRPLLDTSGDHR